MGNTKTLLKGANMKISGKRIFITGGAGFIGSTLVGQLIEDNEITIFDNLSRNALSKTSYIKHKNLRLEVGNVLDIDQIRKSIKKSDIIVHCAGIAGIDTVVKNPIKTMQVNMIGSANVLEAASELPTCERVICFSTSEVFGQRALSSAETDTTIIGPVGEARWTYAVSKLAEEHLAISYWKEKRLPTTVVRPFNIYGPNQVGEGAIRIFIERAIKNEPLEIHGDGTQIRAWCYVDDMVNAVLLAMHNEKAIGESFNIGNARSVETIFGLANTVIRVLKSESVIKFSHRKFADVELRIPSTHKAKELLGFEAKVNLEEGILRTASSMRLNNLDLVCA